MEHPHIWDIFYLILKTDTSWSKMRAVFYILWLWSSPALLQGLFYHESYVSPSTALVNATTDVICEFFARRTSTVYFSKSNGLLRDFEVLTNVDCDIAFILDNAHPNADPYHKTYSAHSNVFIVSDYADFRCVEFIRSTCIIIDVQSDFCFQANIRSARN